MAKHCLRRMSGKGDEVMAEWDTETASPDRLKEIETEFDKRMKEGYFAADLNKGELIRKFDPEADTLLIPKMQGG